MAAEEKKRPGTGSQRPMGLRRAMSAIQRRPSSSGRPLSSSRPRRPYSAYTRKGDEEEGPKFEAPQSNREWWRAYLKVHSVCSLLLLQRLFNRRRRSQAHTVRGVSSTTSAENRALTDLETRLEPSRPVIRGSSGRVSGCSQEHMKRRVS